MNTDPIYRFKVKIRKRIRSILKDRGYTKNLKLMRYWASLMKNLIYIWNVSLLRV